MKKEKKKRERRKGRMRDDQRDNERFYMISLSAGEKKYIYMVLILFSSMSYYATFVSISIYQRPSTRSLSVSTNA